MIFNTLIGMYKLTSYIILNYINNKNNKCYE